VHKCTSWRIGCGDWNFEDCITAAQSDYAHLKVVTVDLSNQCHPELAPSPEEIGDSE
jgi:hypothetical protein